MHHHVDPNMIFEENRTLGDAGKKLMALGGGIGLIGLIASLVLAFTGHWHRFQQAWLVSFSFWLAISLGALLFVALQHLTKAGWSVVIRRMAELIGAMLPMMFVLLLPVLVPMLLGNTILYPWADSEFVANNHHLHHKGFYFSAGFVLVRILLYFVVWFWISRNFLKWSMAQDSDGDNAWTGKCQKFSAPATLLIAISLTFVSFDLLMSLDPFWFSTIYGVYFFSAGFLSFFATMVISLKWLQRTGRLANAVTVEHYHDLGKYMFAFVFFWGYIAFSQFMLIWYADLPEETRYFQRRFDGPWLLVSYVLLFTHFIIPFAGILSRHVKRNGVALTVWAFFVLAIHWLDMQWLVIPNTLAETAGAHGAAGPVHQPAFFEIVDLTCFVAVSGLYIAGFAWLAKDKSLVPERDPFLTESLAFKNF